MTSKKWLFTLHRSEFFTRLCDLLTEYQIMEIIHSNSSAYLVKFKRFDVFIQLLSLAICLRNAALERSNMLRSINASKEITSLPGMLYYKRGGLCITLNNNITLQLSSFSLKGSQSLFSKIFAPQEGNEAYEDLVNALLGIYIGSIRPWHIVYSNTYIVEWKKDFHEFDVIAIDKKNNFCFVLETCHRLESDFTQSSNLSHFKTHLLDVWLLETLYGLNGAFVYLNLDFFPIRKEQHTLINFEPIKSLTENSGKVKVFYLSSELTAKNRKRHLYIRWNDIQHGVESLLEKIKQFLRSVEATMGA